MRGKDGQFRVGCYDVGIIPACAGKRPKSRKNGPNTWDHPRVCGEKHLLRCAVLDLEGSPPRVRGKGSRTSIIIQWTRITPAYAGKSPFVRRCTMLVWDYPRVCGEKSMVCPRSGPGTGSPPRMRGKELLAADDLQTLRITPACAGKSRCPLGHHPRLRDHPCVCGEKSLGISTPVAT